MMRAIFGATLAALVLAGCGGRDGAGTGGGLAYRPAIA